MPVEDDNDIPPEAAALLKTAEQEHWERALEIGLKIAMRAQQKLGYSSIMMSAQANGDILASLLKSSLDTKAAYARVDLVRGDFQKLT